MKAVRIFMLMLSAVLLCSTSCSTIEQASTHGLANGKYTLKSAKTVKRVYLDVNDERVDAYELRDDGILGGAVILSDDTGRRTFPLPFVLKKQGLDLDVTTILFKYRPPVKGQGHQFTNDMNLAMYAGWRFDRFAFSEQVNLLQKSTPKVRHFAYDVGFILGAGTTPIDAFTTQNKVETDYNALLFQSGVAGFVETTYASFGLGIGWDFLTGSDRKSWIYEQKPYLGIIVGIALN
jgi:hypothetical protein